jgi:hypothetical protein
MFLLMRIWASNWVCKISLSVIEIWLSKICYQNRKPTSNYIVASCGWPRSVNNLEFKLVPNLFSLPPIACTHVYSDNLHSMDPYGDNTHSLPIVSLKSV